MLNSLFEFSLRNRFLVLVFVGLIIAAGVYAMRKLPIDAVPDVTPNQVQILTDSPGLGPVEVEKFITFPVETALSGLPGITLIRSVSRFGLSAVTVYFEEGMDIYFCRRLVMERLPRAQQAIPPGFGNPEMGPISTGLGEVFQFEVKGQGYSLMQLRTILDWDIALKLRSVPGVVEVNSYGGELQTYEVALDASKLVAYKIPISRVFEAIERNNANAGGGYIVHAQEQYLIRGEGLVQTLEDLNNIVVATGHDGTPITIRNIAQTRFEPLIRQGAVTRDEGGEVVTGVALMLIGENSRVVVNRIKAKLTEIQKSLPPGVTVDPFYDRTDLVRNTIQTVATNLTEGALLVIAVLFLLLGNLRAGLIVASVIPLSMLVALTGMLAAGISGNLMSLGAIDFGLIVDGSVVMIENIMRHLAERRKQMRPSSEEIRQVILRSGREVLRPIFFAVGIIIIVYLPILTLQGVEGKMFRPMALTVIFALVAALVLAFTVAPVFVSLFLRREVREEETWVIRWAKRVYQPLLSQTLRHPVITAGVAALAFAGSLALASILGAEFIPKLDEGAIALQAWRFPSVALEESVKSTNRIGQILGQFPEVTTVVPRTGRPEIATDPMGVEVSDVYIILKPKSEWRTAHTKADLIEAFDRALKAAVPGTIFSYSQPIELRVQELIAGVRSDIAITIFGEDMDTLKRLGDQVVQVVSGVQGAADTKAEQVAGMPYLRVIINREAIARYGINASEILGTVEALGGRVAGQVVKGNQRFFIQVRFRPEDRSNFDRIKDIRVADPSGRQIPLSQLADIRTETGLAQISRENIHRRLAVETNVRSRDLASFVAEAQRAVEAQIPLPKGYWIEWGGQFQQLQEASTRLAIVVPIALFLIFVLLYTTFNAVGPAMLIFLNVPLAATGGIIALALRGMPFSISAAVGFIALFGVAVLNGVVLMAYILDLQKQGLSRAEAASQGAMIRLRPVLMTALVASLGFVPMALSTSAGAEVQQPLATVVIGGLVTSTALTLLVLPTLYVWEERLRETWAQRRGKAEEASVPYGQEV
ncbi:MAG: CzcABC family efflux RND transporter, transmembrane protein [Nitrospira sp.]|jgi:cobalt-zinc-cadmium resistance protein CzcA|nr:MAG: CzcABC family efflux RND transporter, transmembrane protein [Nitrospira sp.]